MFRLNLSLRRGPACTLLRASLTALGLLAYQGAASAQSLPQALSRAYLDHPAIAAERERLKAIDEGVSQAVSGWRPTVTTSSDVGVNWDRIKYDGISKVDKDDRVPSGVTVLLDQPVFRGGRTTAEVGRAEATVKVGRENLLAVEQQVLLDAVTAYMDVLRDRRIVTLRVRDVHVLSEQYKASKARLEVGENTRTDVEQSRARLELSRSDLATARADLQVSEASFVRVIGTKARKLSWPRVSRRLPTSLNHAISLADQFNPAVLAAVHAETAARRQIDVSRGALLPTVSLQVEFTKRNNLSSTVDYTKDTTVRGVFSVPIYQSGAVYSRLREAKHLASQQRILILDQRRQVRAQVVSAWSRHRQSRENIRAIKAQISANILALEGVREEAKVGTRTVLDVLNSERELVESRVSLARAERDHIVSAYDVITAVGRMTAMRLGLSVAVYDPTVHLKKVRHKWFGGGVESDDYCKDKPSLIGCK